MCPHVCRFQRCFVSLAHAINVAFGVGMKVSAVDACHSKHVQYLDGRLHILMTYDGNNQILPMAWMWAETESGDTYEWFAEQCLASGCARYLNKASVVFSDRQKGIDKFTDAFHAVALKCFWHVLKNCKENIKGCGKTFDVTLTWELQRAPTRQAFVDTLQLLKAQCPSAARYLDDQDHDSMYQYAFNEKGYGTHNFKASTHSFSTSQGAEATNWAFEGARYLSPYRSNCWILRWMGEHLSDRLRAMESWIEKGHELTPYAYNLWDIQVEISMRTGYSVTVLGGEIYDVANKRRPDKPHYEVDLKDPKCCIHARIHQQPCRHMAAVFHFQKSFVTSRSRNQLLLRFWPKCFHAAYYRDILKRFEGVRIPGVYAGPFRGEDSDRTLPPIQTHKKPGRPRIKRYRHKKQTKKTIMEKFPDVVAPEYAYMTNFV